MTEVLSALWQVGGIPPPAVPRHQPDGVEELGKFGLVELAGIARSHRPLGGEQECY